MVDKSSLFLTKELVDGCWGIVGSAITKTFITDVPGRVAACIEVRGASGSEIGLRPFWWKKIIGEQNKDTWPYPYDQFVYRKGETAFRTKMSNHEAQVLAPHLLTEDDFKYAGGVYRNGIVVATSGLASWEDDFLVSNMLLSMIEARVLKESNKKHRENVFYLGDTPKQ